MSLYGVVLVRGSVEVNVGSIEYELKLSYAKGMVGTIPVFSNRKDAENFSNGVGEVFEINSSTNTIKHTELTMQ